jgi:hypothetical protein
MLKLDFINKHKKIEQKMKKTFLIVVGMVFATASFAQEKAAKGASYQLGSYRVTPQSEHVAVTEVLHTVQLSDSTVAQFLKAADNNISYRKLDVELKQWSEWVPVKVEDIPKEGLTVTLNGKTYLISK